MEEWHQKLHNNTSPDDVVICEALIAFIQADLNIAAYWGTLEVRVSGLYFSCRNLKLQGNSFKACLKGLGQSFLSHQSLKLLQKAAEIKVITCFERRHLYASQAIILH